MGKKEKIYNKNPDSKYSCPLQWWHIELCTFGRGLEVTFIFVWGEKTLEWSFSTYTYILENILLQKLLPKMQTLLVVWSIQEESRKALLHLHIRCCVGLGTSRVIRSPCKSTCDHSRVFSHRSKTNVTSSPLQNVFQYGIIAVGKNILNLDFCCRLFHFSPIYNVKSNTANKGSLLVKK